MVVSHTNDMTLDNNEDSTTAIMPLNHNQHRPRNLNCIHQNFGLNNKVSDSMILSRCRIPEFLYTLVPNVSCQRYPPPPPATMPSLPFRVPYMIVAHSQFIPVLQTAFSSTPRVSQHSPTVVQIPSRPNSSIMSFLGAPVVHFMVSLLYVGWAIFVVRKNSTTHHKYLLGSTIGLAMHFLCVLLHPYIRSAVCHVDTHTDAEIKKCYMDRVDPVMMALDQFPM